MASRRAAWSCASPRLKAPSTPSRRATRSIRVAQRYGVAPDAITGFATNLLTPGDALRVGAVILVPDGTGE
jgi:hypothetical protein